MPPTKPPTSPPATSKPPAAASGSTSNAPKVASPIKPPMAKPAAAAPGRAHTPKVFSVTSYTGSKEGEKIVIYGKSGIGKTTLAAQVPNAVFIPIDDGARRIVNPLTNTPVNAIPNVESFDDLRDALHQPNLFAEGVPIVVDTISKTEPLATDYIMRTTTKDNKLVNSFRQFGWDGERYLLDQYRLLLTDFDALVRKGHDIIFLAQLGQITIANAEGLDYLEDGPKLQHRKDCSVRAEVTEWADHVFRVGYLNFDVQQQGGLTGAKARVGKVSSTDVSRAVFTGGAMHYLAKTRPVSRNRTESYRIPSVVSFETPEDNSLWQYVFNGAVEG